MTIKEKVLCGRLERKTFTKTCYRIGCGNVFTTTAFNAIYCGDEECKRLVCNANSAARRERARTKPSGPRRATRARRQEKTIEVAAKWLSIPLRK